MCNGSIITEQINTEIAQSISFKIYSNRYSYTYTIQHSKPQTFNTEPQTALWLKLTGFMSLCRKPT